MRSTPGPELVEDTSFSYAMWGYKREDVDSFLAGVADAWRISLDEIREQSFQDLGDRMGELLQHAKDTAEKLVADAETTAGEIQSRAQAAAVAEIEAATAEGATIRENARIDAATITEEAEDKVRALEVEEAHVRDRLHELRVMLNDLGERMGALESLPPRTVVLPEASGNGEAARLAATAPNDLA